MRLTAGARLGPYEILAPLGAGGMGDVYRARDTRLDRFVAVKVLSSHLPADPLALLAITAFMAVVALAAAYVPARRAARMDPLAALRHD